MTSSYGAAGIRMDRYEDTLNRMIALAIEWKGASLSTDEKELIGHMLRQMANESSGTNEKVQALFDAMSISNNSGIGLDNVLELINMRRQSSARSKTTEKFTASKATTVLAGSVVRTEARVTWTTDEDLVFTGAGSAYVGITCTVDGANNAAPGEINILVTSIPGITAVTNEGAAIPGRIRETDAELKQRHSVAVSTSGERDAASIAESIGNASGVSAVRVVEDYDADEVRTYVIGGTDEDIAAAMDAQVTIGVGPILTGTTSVDVYSVKLKQNRTMKFTRGADVDVYIDLVLLTTELYPADGDLQVTEAIAGMFDGRDLGDDVIYLMLPRYIYTIPGCIIQSLKIGTSPTPTGTADIAMNDAQRATAGVVRDDAGTITASNISISHG